MSPVSAREWPHAKEAECAIDWPQMRCPTMLALVQSYLQSSVSLFTLCQNRSYTIAILRRGSNLSQKVALKWITLRLRFAESLGYGLVPWKVLLSLLIDTIGILLSCMNTIGNDESGIFLFAHGIA